jgi:hypothetical protein
VPSQVTRRVYKDLLSVGQASGFIRLPLEGKEKTEANPRGFGPIDSSVDSSEEVESPLTTQHTKSRSFDSETFRNLDISITPQGSRSPRMSDDGLRDETVPPVNRAKALLSMPLPGKSGSPRFTGQNPKEDLRGFLDEFEYQAEQAGLSDQEKKKELCRYVTSYSIKELWKAQSQYREGTWDEYKSAILAKYPEVEEKEKYTVAKMVDYVSDWRDKRLRSLAKFGQFDRGFDQRVAWLEDRAKISKEEKARLYWKVFHPKLREQLETRIIAGHPNLDPHEEYTMTQIRNAVRWVFGRKDKKKVYDSDTSDSGDDSEDDDSNEFTRAEEEAREKKRRSGRKTSGLSRDRDGQHKRKPEENDVLKEMFNQLNLRSEKEANERRQLQTSVLALHHRLDRQGASGANDNRVPNNPSTPQRWEGNGGYRPNNRGPDQASNRGPSPYSPMSNGNNPARYDNLNKVLNFDNQASSSNYTRGQSSAPGFSNPSRPIYCIWCGSNGHSRIYCADLRAALESGQVKKDPNSNNLLLPTGMAIPRGDSNTTLKERVSKAMSVNTQFFESYFLNAAPVQE